MEQARLLSIVQKVLIGMKCLRHLGLIRSMHGFQDMRSAGGIRADGRLTCPHHRSILYAETGKI